MELEQCTTRLGRFHLVEKVTKHCSTQLLQSWNTDIEDLITLPLGFGTEFGSSLLAPPQRIYFSLYLSHDSDLTAMCSTRFHSLQVANETS